MGASTIGRGWVPVASELSHSMGRALQLSNRTPELSHTAAGSTRGQPTWTSTVDATMPILPTASTLTWMQLYMLPLHSLHKKGENEEANLDVVVVERVFLVRNPDGRISERVDGEHARRAGRYDGLVQR